MSLFVAKQLSLDWADPARFGLGEATKEEGEVMEANTFVLAYYLGLIVFVGNFVMAWRTSRNLSEI